MVSKEEFKIHGNLQLIIFPACSLVFPPVIRPWKVTMCGAASYYASERDRNKMANLVLNSKS